MTNLYLRKNNSNKKLYKEITKLPLPNHPVTSRWGTWLKSAIFYSNNISPILLFIENLDEHHSAASSKIHKRIENDLQTLKSELSNLSNVFQFLPIAITELEARQLVVDADSVLNNVKISLPNQVYREKWQQIVDKNPDLQVVVNSTLFACSYCECRHGAFFQRNVFNYVTSFVN